MNQDKQKRILLVDDSKEISRDFYNILSPADIETCKNKEASLMELAKLPGSFLAQNYKVDSSSQGQKALELVQNALLSGEPYALAFIEMGAPHDQDGIDTIKRIWEVDPSIQMVICSADSDRSWQEIHSALGNPEKLLMLKKTYEAFEINQLVAALTRKWELIADLHIVIKHRNAELERLYSLTQATLESIYEGIIAVGLDDEILMYNEKFIQQWGISKDLLKSQKSSLVFETMCELVADPVHFLKIATALIRKPVIKKTIEWQLNSGIILEQYAKPQYLHGEITGIVFSFRDITEHKKLERQILHQATHDSLTGFPNRALLMDRIKQAIENAKRFNLNVGILKLNLDLFKEVNDTFGHKAGDMFLKYQAKNLAKLVRANDTVARLGGDDFVVVLTSQSHDSNFIRIIGKIIDLFLKPCRVENHEITATVSIGISIYPRDGKDADTLLKNADAALYHAKEQGRNKFQFYLQDFNQRILQRAELKVALAQAISKNELSINYQPLIELKSNKIIGIEALLRWHHPILGMIPPKLFIPIAEETGLIIEIGEWVLRTACKQAKIWHESSAFSAIKLSVNVSVKQFRQKHFVSIVRKVLEETQLNPGCLELEITESLLIGNIPDVIKKMNELKAMQVRFAMDDFGTGYSSLNYLKNFPFDTVKIDKSFMDNISTDLSNASIVKAIIDMTKTLGMDVLAEGVEHQEQVDFLLENHSNQVQGYYFSKPLTVEQCTELLRSK